MARSTSLISSRIHRCSGPCATSSGSPAPNIGCGIAQCGACTVHINGQAMRSCSVPIGDLDGASITTIEGLSPDSKHPVQQAWLAEDVPQCG